MTKKMRPGRTYGWRIPVALDKTGRAKPTRKTTAEEVNRRRDHALRLWREGATRTQIAAALDVSADSVGNDLAKRGVAPNQPRLTGLPVDPEPIDWLEPPSPPERALPPYQNSVTLHIWQTFVRDSRGQHHANRLAHDAADAEEAGDRVWLAEAAEILQSAITEATRLHRVVVDQQARLRGQREELESPTRRTRVRLRVVDK